MPQEEDFRNLLTREFSRRLEVNPRYSLRAFAQHLGIYHATLSALLAGRRPFTERSIAQLGTSLGFSPQVLATYRLIEKSKTQTRHPSSSIDPKHIQQIGIAASEDEYALLSQWHHDAILECLSLPQVPQNAKAIAAFLNLNAALVITSLEMLQRMHWIEPRNDGGFRVLKPHTTTILSNRMTTAGRRAYQKSLLTKSAEALDNISLGERDHSSITITFDRADLPVLQKMLTKFRRQVADFTQRPTAKPEGVYLLQLGFFPISKLNTLPPNPEVGSPAGTLDAESLEIKT